MPSRQGIECPRHPALPPHTWTHHLTHVDARLHPPDTPAPTACTAWLRNIVVRVHGRRAPMLVVPHGVVVTFLHSANSDTHTHTYNITHILKHTNPSTHTRAHPYSSTPTHIFEHPHTIWCVRALYACATPYVCRAPKLVVPHGVVVTWLHVATRDDNDYVGWSVNLFHNSSRGTLREIDTVSATSLLRRPPTLKHVPQPPCRGHHLTLHLLSLRPLTCSPSNRQLPHPL